MTYSWITSLSIVASAGLQSASTLELDDWPTDAAEPGSAMVFSMRVLDGSNGLPLPGAEVFVTDLSSPERKRALFGVLDPEGVLSGDVRRQVSQEGGWVFLSGDPRQALIAGRKDERWGMLLDDPGDLRLLLHAEPALRVSVVDPEGLPVGGIPVVLRRTLDHECLGGTWDAFPALSSPKTGIAELRHVGAFEELAGAPLLAALYLPLEQPVAVELDRHDPFRSSICLRLPPTGSVEVSVETPDGSPWRDPCVISLSGGRGSSHVLQWCGIGRAVFEHVGLGQKLQATVETPGHEFALARGAGPRASGDRTAIRVRLGAELPILAGRLIGPGGRICTRFAGDAHFSSLFSGAWSVPFVTDGGGRFRLPVRGGHVDQGSIELWGRDADGPPAMGKHRWDFWDLKRGQNELVDLQLEPMECLVRGRVVDREGRGVAGARITLAPPEATSDRPVSIWVEGPAADGSFAVFGSWPQPVLALRVFHGDFPPSEEVTARVGDGDVRVVLDATNDRR